MARLNNNANIIQFEMGNTDSGEGKKGVIAMNRLGKMVLMQACMLILPMLLFAGPIPDTGQSKCYDDSSEIPCPNPEEAFYGQDAQYAGPARSYTKLGQNGVELPGTTSQNDGWIMTRDNVTGLIWEIKTDDGSLHDKDNTYTWYDSNPATNGGDDGTPGDGTDTEDFIMALNEANFGGYSDWRLPTIKELSSLINSSIPDPGPTIDTAWFSSTMSSNYWSSTAHAYYKNSAWLMYFNNGCVGYGYKSNSRYVRAVRGSQSTNNLVDNGDGTVTDTGTGLMWQKAITAAYTWQQALAYAEELVLPAGGYSDWRLPNRNELQTLVDYTRYDPSIDPLLQMSTMSSDYWSSTTDASNTAHARFVHFNYGDVHNYFDKSGSCHVRAVRAGQSGTLGDINADGSVDLVDAVLALRVTAGVEPAQPICKTADVNGDEVIGLVEAVYAVQHVAGLR